MLWTSVEERITDRDSRPSARMDASEFMDTMDPSLAELGDEFTLGDIDGERGGGGGWWWWWCPSVQCVCVCVQISVFSVLFTLLKCVSCTSYSKPSDNMQKYWIIIISYGSRETSWVWTGMWWWWWWWCIHHHHHHHHHHLTVLLDEISVVVVVYRCCY